MTSAAKMARALAARELAQCPIDWSMIERDRQMTSDVKPATDYEISGIKAAMPDHFYQKHRMLADMGLLLARIAADAARIRELEAAGRALLTCPAIADIASEDRDPEDVVAERKMRAALGSRRDG